MSKSKFNDTPLGIMPCIPEKDKKNVSYLDVFSRLMMDRIIFIGEEITDEVSNVVQGQLLFLNNEDPKKPIHMYINSPGGSVSAGLGIYDTMNFIDAPVYTVCTGSAYSMATILLCAGEKGHRSALPNSSIMIHQPSSWSGWKKQTDTEIHAKELLRTRDTMERIYSAHCGKSKKVVHKALENDNWMTSEEALKFGLIDNIKFTKDKWQTLENGALVTHQN